jgi:hypothetical protein
VIEQADTEAVQERDGEQQQRMREQRFRPMARANREALGARGDQRREQQPRQPVIESEQRERRDEARREIAQREDPRELLQRRVHREAEPDERQRARKAADGGLALGGFGHRWAARGYAVRAAQA